MTRSNALSSIGLGDFVLPLFLTCLSLFLSANIMQTVDNTKKKTKFFLLLICSAASQIISELFSEKLFRSQLCFFDDVDYTEAVDYTIPNPRSTTNLVFVYPPSRLKRYDHESSRIFLCFHSCEFVTFVFVYLPNSLRQISCSLINKRMLVGSWR